MTAWRKTVTHIEEIAKACGRNPGEIALVAVTKGRSLDDLLKIYSEGCRLFGESRMQEALPKMDLAPKDIQWHLIGTLQKNKVQKALGRFQLIHSVDSVELAKKIASASLAAGLTTSILLQVNTFHEEAKHGLTQEEWQSAYDSLLNMPALSIEGLMTIGPRSQDPAETQRCFAALRTFRDQLRRQGGLLLPHLSMGMSGDYPLAIREGATLLRIGSALFIE